MKNRNSKIPRRSVKRTSKIPRRSVKRTSKRSRRSVKGTSKRSSKRSSKRKSRFNMTEEEIVKREKKLNTLKAFVQKNKCNCLQRCMNNTICLNCHENNSSFGRCVNTRCENYLKPSLSVCRRCNRLCIEGHSGEIQDNDDSDME